MLGPYELNNIYCGECSELMRSLPDDSIDMWLTSPPYDSLRTYRGYTFDFESIATQLWRVTKPGGVGVWVVGDETKDNCESLSSFKQAIYFVEMGFNLHDTMIYEKNGMEFIRYGHTKYPGTFEYMFVFCKGKPETFNLIRDRNNIHSGSTMTGSLRSPNGTMKFSHSNGRKVGKFGSRGNVWRYNVGYMQDSKDKESHDHPAIFPEALARDHIISWSNPNDIILDPMCGSGTTCKMAHLLGRHYLGFEISDEYCQLAKHRVANVEMQPFLILPTSTEVKSEQLEIFPSTEA